MKIYLIGNKSEMVDQREVTKERALEYAKMHGIHRCFETSAKTGSMVEDVFSCAGKELYMQNEKDEEANTATPAQDTSVANPTTTLKPVPKRKVDEGKKKKGGCC